ncbi:MAG: hypothetical protein ACI4WS_03455 [Oscillospiraceae bacterium]
MTSAAVNNTAAGKTPLNKLIGIGMAVFAVIEAVVTFFLVMKPLYINPVYAQRNAYIEEGRTCIVKIFGKTFASQAEIDGNQIILSLLDTIVNITLIYLVITGVLLVLAFCFYKGFAFAKSYLIAVFGAKALIGLVPITIPFAYFRNSMRIFGAIDAVICLVACAYFVYLSSVEYADDMLLTNEQIGDMWKRGKFSAVMFLVMAAAAVFASFGMSAYGNIGNAGGNWSIVIGWLDDTSVAQGVVLMLLMAAALIGSILYVREGDWAMIYYFSFGAAMTVTNLVAILFRFLWVVKTYNPMKSLANAGDAYALAWVGANGMTTRWWIATIMLILSLVAAAALTFLAFTKIKSKLSFKISERDKKPAIAVLIGVGSLVLSFVLTMIAVFMWDKQHYGAVTLGAMDYMYFIAYGGITLFLAVAMWCGYSFTKFGTLALYIMIASCNFSSIFTAFGERGIKVANSIAARDAAIEQGLAEIPGVFKGYNYIVSGIFFILSVIACLAIIVVFVVKEVKDYMYEKRYS